MDPQCFSAFWLQAEKNPGTLRSPSMIIPIVLKTFYIGPILLLQYTTYLLSFQTRDCCMIHQAVDFITGLELLGHYGPLPINHQWLTQVLTICILIELRLVVFELFMDNLELFMNIHDL